MSVCFPQSPAVAASFPPTILLRELWVLSMPPTLCWETSCELILSSCLLLASAAQSRCGLDVECPPQAPVLELLVPRW